MTTKFELTPVTLEGNTVRLEPLTHEHADDLLEAGKVSTLWRYMPIPPPRDLDDTYRWIKAATDAQDEGTEVPFAIIELESGKAVGSTRYLDIRAPHRGLEIGWTWIGLDYQRTGVNTECKYLLLKHAFETLGAIRVQLKTDRRNRQSQTAIERIGAQKEGTLRYHYVLHDGHYRDTVMFSITEKTWPDVKRQLQLRLL